MIRPVGSHCAASVVTDVFLLQHFDYLFYLVLSTVSFDPVTPRCDLSRSGPNPGYF